MWKSVQMENVTKSIIRDIKDECALKGVTVGDGLASYVIKLTVLNPKNNFTYDQPLKPDDLRKLVDLCTEKLCKENSPSTACLRMQVEFLETHQSRREITQTYRHNHKVRCAALIKEIADSVAFSKDDLESLYHKIIVVLILKSGLGNPHQVNVIKEATAALTSVFPPSEMVQFATLPHKEKEMQIYELSQIVMGIRLFNRDCQKGGEGIEDLPSLLEQMISGTLESIETFLHKLMRNIDYLTTALEIHLDLRSWSEEDLLYSRQPEVEDVDPEEMEFMKETLIASRQLEIYMRKLIAEVEQSNRELVDLRTNFKKRLEHIHETVRYRTAIPTIQVYPQFMEISAVWGKLQDEMVILSSVNNVMWNLQSYIQVLDQIDGEVIKYMLKDWTILSDDDRINAPPDAELLETLYSETNVLKPTEPDFETLEPMYLGFCPWALVSGDGLLIPGNLRIGLFPWKGQYYAVSSAEAGFVFARNADSIIDQVHNLARRIPELSELLQVSTHLEQLPITDVIVREGRKVPVQEHKAIQTELHPIAPNKDPTYTWDLWEFKRRAIQLANIVKCRTHSTQTDRSHFRMAVPTQAGCPKTVACQTKRDNSSNVPTLGTFIFGLRGRRDDKQFVIHLTRPADEKECVF